MRRTGNGADDIWRTIVSLFKPTVVVFRLLNWHTILSACRLAAMTELEREMELADRAERRQQEMQRKQLLRAAEGAEEAGAKPRKDRTTAARRSGREVREEHAKKSAMEELKAARDRKARGQRAHAAEAVEAAGVTEEDEEGEAPLGYGEELFSEDELGGGARWEPRDDFEEDAEKTMEASYDEVKTIQVRRHRLEEWVAKPFFASVLPGCMVRLSNGPERTADGQVVLGMDGRPVASYVAAQVVGVEEKTPGYHKYMHGGPPWKTPYPFGPSGAKTSLWLKVLRGGVEASWPLAQVSNSGITENEFRSWHNRCEAAKLRHITRGEVEEVRDRLMAAENYVYSAADVAQLLEEKRLKGQAPRNVALERARLVRERDAAAEAGEEARAVELDAQLELLAAAAAGARRGGGASMAELNRKNADLNFQVALQSGGDGGAGGGAGKKDGGGAAGTLDPFSRRVTRPIVYWNTQRDGKKGQGGDGDDGYEEVTRDAAGMEVDGEDGQREDGPAPSPKPITLVDLSGLDLLLLDSGSRVATLARKLLGNGPVERSAAAAAAVAGRPTITLAQYKQRNGTAF